MCTGWTWEYIDGFVTIPRLLEMTDYWRKRPPVHEMLASFFGITKRAHVESESASADDSGAAFFRDFIAAGGTVSADVLGG